MAAKPKGELRFGERKSAAAAAQQNAGFVLLLARHLAQTGALQRLARGAQRQRHHARHAIQIFGIEIVGGTEIGHFARDLTFESLDVRINRHRNIRIEKFDATNRRSAALQALRPFIPAHAKGRNGAHSGNYCTMLI